MDTLDLDGDSIDDVLDDVEDVFSIRFRGDELLTVETVGDLHDRLMARLRNDTGACATSMAFYRIRRALVAQGWTGKIRPDTPLAVARHVKPGRFLRALANESALRMPSVDMGRVGMVCGWLAVSSVALLIVAFASRSGPMLWVGLGLLLILVSLLALNPGRMPKGMATVGDLARQVVTRNHGSLIVEGAASRDKDVWCSLQQIVAGPAGLSPSKITRDTTFFRPKETTVAA